MSSQVSFPPRLPLPSKDLPLTLISLEDWILVRLFGEDIVKYLQGQLTCDVAMLRKDQYTFSAHCDAKGKMYSNLCLFNHQEGLAFIERRSVCYSQLKALKKYAVFSKSSITIDDSAVLLGVAGFQVQDRLRALFSSLPNITHPVVYSRETTLLYFTLPAERFLLITTGAMRDYLLHVWFSQAKLNNSQQWLALDIEAGYPIIDSAVTLKFIPQAVNIQALGGISFEKGCYVGQEMVARARYRGTNKRTLYWLSGNASRFPVPGDDLELKIGENWRRTGVVLAVCQLQDNNIWLQAVLNKDVMPNSQFRVREDTSSLLKICSLPHSFAE